MKISSSFVVAALCAAAHSSMSSPIGATSKPKNFLASQGSEVSRSETRHARMISRTFGRRAPPLTTPRDSESAQTASLTPETGAQRSLVTSADGLVSNVAGGLVGGLPVVGGPLSGVLGSNPGSTVVNAVETTLGGLPVVGGPIAGLLGTSPLVELIQPGQPMASDSGLLGTITETVQGLPVLGGLFKALPLDSLHSAVGGLPVVGGPIAGLLGTPPFNREIQPGKLSDARAALPSVKGLLPGAIAGQVSGLLGTVADTVQGLPVVGDLAKTLPLDALRQGDLLANALSTASGLIGSLPVVGSPLSHTLDSTVSSIQALPLSLNEAPDTGTFAQSNSSSDQSRVTDSAQAAAGGALSKASTVPLSLTVKRKRTKTAEW